MYTIFCLYVCRPEKGTRLITDGCEPPCGCWEMNSGPLEEQAMLLTTEPSFQPFHSFLNIYFYVYVYACVSYTICVQYLQMPEEGIRSSGTEFQLLVSYHVGAGT